MVQSEKASDNDVIQRDTHPSTGSDHGCRDNNQTNSGMHPDSPHLSGEIEKAKKRILKNVFCLAVAFLFALTSMAGLSRLQSSIHDIEGLGTVCQALASLSMAVCCMFVPKLLIGAIGHKWTMCVSFCGHLVWLGANAYPMWATMIPAAVIAGGLGACVWTAQGSYITRLGLQWQDITGEPRPAVMSRFFGYTSAIVGFGRSIWRRLYCSI